MSKSLGKKIAKGLVVGVHQARKRRSDLQAFGADALVETASNLSTLTKRQSRRLARRVRRAPGTAMALAAGAGALVGLLLGSRRSAN